MISFQLTDHQPSRSQVQPLLDQLNNSMVGLAKNSFNATRFGLPVPGTEDIYLELVILRTILQAKAQGADCPGMPLRDLLTLIKNYLNVLCTWDPDV